MNSRSLLVDTDKSPLYFRQKQGGKYEFTVIGFTILPLRLKNRRMPSADQCVLTFDYQCPAFISFISALVGPHNIMCRNIKTCNEWNSFSIDLTPYKDLIKHQILTSYKVPLLIMIAPFLTAANFRIKNIRLRTRTPDEKIKASITFDYKNRPLAHAIDTAGYLYDSVFPNKITGTEVFENEIRIACRISGCGAPPLFLCELPAFRDFTTDNLEIVQEIEPGKDRFETTIPRTATQSGQPYDRIYSRWILVYRHEGLLYICSHGRYADEIRTGHTFPAWAAKTKKGLGAYKHNHLFTDLKDLGISYITFNIRINNFLRLDPGPDNIPFEYNGKTYYADRRKIEKYDRTILTAVQFGINVSAIILVYPELWSRDPKVGRMLEHPEYERGGAYTMPNITNIDSLNLYAAALDFLAARYNRPDGKFGRIHRWIAHNEVDAGRVWTNAGNKTDLEFMDIYIKSMRMIYYTARKYDTTAEVFISLDHFWTDVNEEPNCYPSADLLRILLNYSRIEGDFQWGIAIHPYPENLLDPKSWLDDKATHTPKTPMITFKNLEVLDEWIKDPATFYRGQKRTLLLSEQNPNSIDYLETGLQEQAAGLAYAWKKVEACSGIDAYMAHSWIDARFEGGLKTGLRKYPDDEHEPYGLKPSWFVFRDAGTPQQDAAFEFAKKIIGISSWEEITASVQPADETL